MFSASKVFALAAAMTISSFAFAAPPDLWVCADSNNLPYSNNHEQGFENKLAQMVAQDLGRKLQYVWWPASPTLSRKVFRRGACDLIMGIPSKGYDLAEATTPYYSSSYVFVTRRESGHAIQSFDDPSLKTLRIGLHVVDDGFTPAAQELASRGIIGNVVGFNVFGNLAKQNPSADLIRAVENHDVDVAIAWGPLAGYFAQHSAVALDLTPICAASVHTSLPVTFSISIGVRPGEDALREQLNSEIAKRQTDIRALLLSYGVPLRDAETSPGTCK
jgi:mxaJ protein